MPAYSYECDTCHSIEDRIEPIGEARRTIMCKVCDGVLHLRIGVGVQIAPSALENKGGDVRDINSTEVRWDRDMSAYKRMRNKGMQPKGIDGAAELENQVGDQFDVQYKALYDMGVTREHIQEGAEKAREIVEDAGMDWKAPA